jgi:hypothetical protein
VVPQKGKSKEQLFVEEEHFGGVKAQHANKVGNLA